MCASNIARNRDKQILADIILRPGQDRKVELGIYESCIPEPKVSLKFEPDLQQDITVLQTKIDDEGEYRLVCYLESFADRTCHVTIMEEGV
jgi:hypothetical protein